MVKQENKNEFPDADEFIGEDANFESAEAITPEEIPADNVTDESEGEPANSAPLSEADSDWKDKYMRLSAEFDNYRKRTLKEKMDLISTGGEDVVVSILSVLDDFDRAVDAMDQSDDIDSARQGMHLIRQKLVDALKQKGVTEIEAHDQEMDTDLHEAIAKFPSEDRKGKVIDVVQKGYKMKDKVIRFCKVVVGE